MNNFTTNCYEMKRDILSFSKKLLEDVNKVNLYYKKMDM